MQRRTATAAAIATTLALAAAAAATGLIAVPRWTPINLTHALDRNPGGITEREITYEHNGTTLRGYFAAADAVQQPRPAVLVIHEWWGHNEYARQRARALAALGYAAFALDMYGDATKTDSPQRARQLASRFYQNRNLMRERARAGMNAMLQQPEADPNNTAAIGYCFGGTVALELARSGAPLDAAVSFHGGLSTPNPEDAENINATVLVANGAADTFVPTEERNAFIREMENAAVDYIFVEHGGAVHSFTNPDADNRNMDGVAYDNDADRRSWRHTLTLFNEVFE